MKQARYSLAALALLASGCTTAGPFVTSISSDGRGNLIVEKSMVKYNGFLGVVSNESTTTSTIKLFDEGQVRGAERASWETSGGSEQVTLPWLAIGCDSMDGEAERAERASE